MKLAVITGDPLYDWARHCEEEKEADMLVCPACGELFDDERTLADCAHGMGREAFCPSCREDIHKRIRDIFDEYTSWGARANDVLFEIDRAVDEL